jgi:hypothetical protein
MALLQIKNYDTAMFLFEILMETAKTDSLKKAFQKSLSSCYFALDSISNKRLIIAKKWIH